MTPVSVPNHHIYIYIIYMRVWPEHSLVPVLIHRSSTINGKSRTYKNLPSTCLLKNTYNKYYMYVMFSLYTRMYYKSANKNHSNPQLYGLHMEHNIS